MTNVREVGTVLEEGRRVWYCPTCQRSGDADNETEAVALLLAHRRTRHGLAMRAA